MAIKRAPKTPEQRAHDKAEQERLRKANVLLSNATDRVTFMNYNLRTAFGELTRLREVFAQLKPLHGKGKGLKKLEVPEELLALFCQLEQMASQHLPQLLDSAEDHIFPERRVRPRSAKLEEGRDEFTAYASEMPTPAAPAMEIALNPIVEMPEITYVAYKPTPPVAPALPARALAA